MCVKNHPTSPNKESKNAFLESLSRKSSCFSFMTKTLTIAFAINSALVEDHDILGECSSFVTEDVFDLAELFVQSGGTSLSRGVIAGIVHFPVPVDVEAVPQTNDLHTSSRY